MSRVRADRLTDKAGTGAPTFPSGAVVTGVCTATSFSGAATGLTGNFAGNAGGLSGTPDVTVGALNATSAVISADGQVGGALTVTGNFTVQGTQTIINTSSLEVEDKTVGIGSTSSPSDTTADGAGIQIYGTTDKTLLWQKGSGCFERSVPDRMKGVFETVAAATTYIDGAAATGPLVVELDLSAATTYTYTVPAVSASGNGSNIGIVSFKNMPADAQNGVTVTLITTQAGAHGGAVGYGNTLALNGIGATCTVIPVASGTSIAGISTRGNVGSATTVTLTPTINNSDFISFFVHYTGGTNTDLNSYKVYVTKNGAYAQNTVGI